MEHVLTWLAAIIMLIGAVMLVTGIGAAGLWIAVIAVGVAVVAIDAFRHRQAQHHV
jgi:tellurite resistance protein TehA-like permease